MLASVSGFQMLRFGQFWLIFEITGSPLSLGWIGLANGVPAIVLNLFGGVAADRIDQRRMVMISQSIIAMLIFFLATITLMGFVNQWHLITIAFLAGAVEAFDQPARRVLFPQLVNRKDLMSAVAMNAAIWPGTRILAPAIAGVIIAISSSAANFYVAGIGFLVMAAVTFRLRLPPHLKTSQTRPIHDILQGLHFIRKDTTFSFLIAMTFFSSFFGMA
jgi:MFS family permease